MSNIYIYIMFFFCLKLIRNIIILNLIIHLSILIGIFFFHINIYTTSAFSTNLVHNFLYPE